MNSYKKVLLSSLLFASANTYSYQCINKLTNVPFQSGAQTIRVPIHSKISKGENIFANVSDYIDCKNDEPWAYIDTLYVIPYGIHLGNKLTQQGFNGGAYINSNRYYANNSSRIDIFSLKDEHWHPVNIDMFFKTPDSVGSFLHIAPGDIIMTVNLHFSGYPPTETSERDFTWTFVADNEAILTTGTCSINNNRVIDVDFGEVSRTSISDIGLNTFHKVIKDINIDCPDQTLNQMLKISLSADYASFSNTAFKTSTNGLGVEIYHDGNVIAPFTGFNTYLNNGKGSDSITFTLVKDKNASKKDLREGDFYATASLVVSQP